MAPLQTRVNSSCKLQTKILLAVCCTPSGDFMDETHQQRPHFHYLLVRILFGCSWHFCICFVGLPLLSIVVPPPGCCSSLSLTAAERAGAPPPTLLCPLIWIHSQGSTFWMPCNKGMSYPSWQWHRTVYVQICPLADRDKCMSICLRICQQQYFAYKYVSKNMYINTDEYLQ